MKIKQVSTECDQENGFIHVVALTECGRLFYRIVQDDKGWKEIGETIGKDEDNE